MRSPLIFSVRSHDLIWSCLKVKFSNSKRGDFVAPDWLQPSPPLVPPAQTGRTHLPSSEISRDAHPATTHASNISNDHLVSA